jgi:hypothetical protein
MDVPAGLLFNGFGRVQPSCSFSDVVVVVAANVVAANVVESLVPSECGGVFR